MTTTHATCVALGDAGVLIRGPSGAGKSDLALRLIDQGATLVSDDYCDIRSEDGRLFATPPKEIAGKIEIRGHGIVDMPYHDSIRIRLVVDLVKKENIDRLPEIQTCMIEDIMTPHLSLDPDTPSAAAKIRLIVRSDD
jgi:HPr kinase/phosphorylase